MKKKTTKHTNPQSLVRYIRIFLGLSQAKVAAACGLTPNDVCRIERGDHSIGIQKIMKLAAFLGISIQTLAKDDYGSAIQALGPPRRDLSDKQNTTRISTNKARIGNTGETLVARWERQKLQGTVYAAGVNEGYADDPDAGFDILSFHKDGRPICIEVKATSGGQDEPFYMTRSEKEFMELCWQRGISYELHRVYNLQLKGSGKRVIYTAEELMNFNYQIASYSVRRCS